MDPLSALGIAAAVAQFLDVGFKLSNRLTEYNKTTINGVPKSLESINTQLPLLLNALQRVKSDIQVNKLDTDTRCILRGVVHGCSNIVTEIEDLMNRASKQPGETLATKLKKVLHSLKNDERILSLDKNLQTYIQVLILHHVVDAADVPPPVPEEIKYFEVREKVATPFVERQQHIERLDELFHDATRSQVKKPTVVVLHGEKSVGKSQIALDYCQQSHAAGQFQSVFWLNASTPESLELSLESVAAVIRRNTEGRSEEKLRFVKTYLEDRWHPWLLVLDGYDHKAFGYEPVLARLPQRGYGGILITSRQLGASSLGPIVEVLKFFTPEEEDRLSHGMRYAIENSQWDRVQDIVQQGFNVNQSDRSIQWPFINRAALYGFEQAVDLFLQKGASMNLVPSQDPALYWAADKGHAGIVTRLLDEEDRTQVRLRPDQYATCASAAVENGNLPVLSILVDRRQVDINTRNRYGRAGFTKAVESGNMELLHYLVAHGAKPKTSEDKAAALLEAVRKDNMDLLKFLIEEAKLDPNAKNEAGEHALYAAASLQEPRSDGESHGLATMKYLLDHGADATLSVKTGEIALHPAALREQIDKVELLLKHGCDPAHPGNGWSPIAQAAKYNSPKVFPILLSWPIEDLVKRKKYREDVLQFAARWDKRELALAVLKTEGGVDVNAKDWRGQTPLLLAIEKGSVPVSRLLIRHGAQQNLSDDKGQYPMLAAASAGLDLVVRDLLRAKDGPGLDVRDKDENTALHLASKGKHENTVRTLLDGGADRDEMNAYGETALDIAEELKVKEVIKVFGGLKAGEA